MVTLGQLNGPTSKAGPAQSWRVGASHLVPSAWALPQGGLSFLTEWLLGSQNNCPKRQKVKATSFLKPGLRY